MVATVEHWNTELNTVSHMQLSVWLHWQTRCVAFKRPCTPTVSLSSEARAHRLGGCGEGGWVDGWGGGMGCFSTQSVLRQPVLSIGSTAVVEPEVGTA